ncbi:MAG: hypothetical protein H5U20_02530 [Rhodobacteraceae bacterium]|nr:hypothetical protein [Paracoccaceae bacterium]
MWLGWAAVTVAIWVAVLPALAVFAIFVLLISAPVAAQKFLANWIGRPTWRGPGKAREGAEWRK